MLLKKNASQNFFLLVLDRMEKGQNMYLGFMAVPVPIGEISIHFLFRRQGRNKWKSPQIKAKPHLLQFKDLKIGFLVKMLGFHSLSVVVTVVTRTAIKPHRSSKFPHAILNWNLKKKSVLKFLLQSAATMIF